jgi:pSer/pThr/pTyr-binding forkhead associated (FHA) protein
VGRGKENDIEVVDATVSRNHARIYSVESNKIMIEDNSSKYGTFVSFQDPY